MEPETEIKKTKSNPHTIILFGVIIWPIILLGDALPWCFGMRKKFHEKFLSPALNNYPVISMCVLTIIMAAGWWALCMLCTNYDNDYGRSQFTKP